MSLLTILLFFVYAYGLGFSLTFFIKFSNFFEKNLMRVGIGLGSIPLVGVIFNILHIPLDWRIFLIISLVIPAYFLIKLIMGERENLRFKITTSDIYFIIVLIIFFITLFMYAKGAFSYPYFEDDDPWAYAVGVKYISVEKDLVDVNNVLRFVRPYPPGYSILLGVLHQTSPFLMWTMKFFNALIISLGIIFFYFFCRSFMKNNSKALFATIILAMIPCYLSHFIWAHAFVVTLLIVALYCFTMIEKDKMWIYPAAVVISALPLTQPTQAIKMFIILGIYFLVKSFYSRKFLVREFGAIIIGYGISILWWFNTWRGLLLQRRIISNDPASTVVTENFILRGWHFIQNAFPYDQGTATRVYTFGDFFIAKPANMINNPVGVGMVISLILIFSLVMIFLTYKSMKKEKKAWVVTSFLWLAFTFLGVNSMTFRLPVGLFAFRFWMLLAIPISIIAAEGFWFLVVFLRKLAIPKIATILILVVLIFLTSGSQKYAVNTAMWGPGQMWTSMEELQGYLWVKDLPVDTKVFAYSGDEQVIGFDKYSCAWCDEVIAFRKDMLNEDAGNVYSWLKRNRYEYLVMDGMAFRELEPLYGENKTGELLQNRTAEIGSSDKFQIAHQTQGMIAFRVV
jgi:hypothetical protein